jgi:uncharacterized membrane protein YraQ (UPF0718 family)
MYLPEGYFRHSWSPIQRTRWSTQMMGSNSCKHDNRHPSTDIPEKSDPCMVEKCNHQGSIDIFFWMSLILVTTFFIMNIIFGESLSAFPWLDTMSRSVTHMVHAMWWGAAIGIVFVGILSKVPREFIMSILGQGGTASGLFRAVGAGVLLDLCSHGILMVATKLYDRGASAGQVVAFLLASPWNSFSLTLVLIGLIGFSWTLMFIFLSMVIAVITGWCFDSLVKGNYLPNNHCEVDAQRDFNFWGEACDRLKTTNLNLALFKEMAIGGFKDSRIVLRWLLFGIILAALLRTLLDVSQFENYFGPSLIGVFITVLAATVVEVCSEGSAPISADIVNRANAPGNGFAFLMAGVATDYTEIVVLKDTTKSCRFAFCLPIIALPQIILIACVINLATS